eukprot:11809175-Alexandrium_andersonii.AAC.1
MAAVVLAVRPATADRAVPDHVRVHVLLLLLALAALRSWLVSQALAVTANAAREWAAPRIPLPSKDAGSAWRARSRR